MVDNVSYNRITTLPPTSFFLFGPRGVGKSTWARTKLTKAHRFDLLNEGLYQSLLTDPSLFEAELRGLRKGSWVVVDEIQRIPALLNEVHRFIEERHLRFALLGSSARKLKTAGTNLLAGRAVRKQMFPFVPEELGKDFAVEKVLRFGSIPLIWMSGKKSGTLEAYVQMYLKEEIRAEALVRNLPGFLRFLPIAALFHGQVVNVSGIARDSGTARTTVEGYLEILEDTLLTFRLPAFETRLRARERKHPKLFWIDTGLVRTVKKNLGPVTSEERGVLLEGWILTLLRAYAEEKELFDEIAYWSPTQARQVEVDFILKRGRDLLAIEVKSPARYTTSMLPGLRAIGELPNVVRRILIYSGSRSLKTSDDIEVWPVRRLINAVENGILWP
jgi:predicted AAA+ superfamily ATPase